jgi:hypothetical protein
MDSSRLQGMFRLGIGRALIVMVFVFSVYSLSNKTPLSDIHWDVPIYLYQAKLVVETPLLQSYSRYSHEIADQVKNQRWPEDEAFPESYWHFSRLGNALILGIVSYVARDWVQTITIAHWVYIGILSASLLLSVLLARSASALLHPSQSKRTINIAAVISAFLYVGSDIYSYLSGNLVGEVPALLLLTAGMLGFVKASEENSYLWAALSGAFAFLLYVVRIEGLFVYVTGIFLLSILLSRRGQRTFSYSIFVLPITCLVVLYTFYAWRFYPLADPRLFLLFGKIQQNSHSGLSPLKLMIAGGGVLWVSSLLSVMYAKGSPSVQFALAWLALQLVPFTVGALSGMPSQSRMYSLTMPTLMILSSQGLAGLIDGLSSTLVKVAVGFVILAILVVSNPILQSVLRQLPGMWRLDQARSYFTVPNYEKVTYPVRGLSRISSFLNGISEPIVLLRGASIPQEYVNLIQVLGPRLRRTKGDIALMGDPANGGDCAKKVLKAMGDPIVFCTKLTNSDITPSSGRRLLLIARHQDQFQVPMQKNLLLEEQGLLLSELKVP